MHSFIQGPLFVASIFIFLFGIAVQIIRCYRLTRPLRHSSPKRRYYVPKDPIPSEQPKKPFSYRLKVFQQTVFGTHPVMIAVTALFHICVLLVPPFVLAHNLMLDSILGISLPSLPERFVDKLTFLVIFGGGYFLWRRLFLKRVRAISSLQDYLMLAIATAPFITGFMAYHQIWHYKTMATMHILTGEFLLIIAPFTKLVHMIYFFFGRFLIIHENNLSRVAFRVWK